MRRRDFLKATALLGLLGAQASSETDPEIPGWATAGDVSDDLATVVAGGMGLGRLDVVWHSEKGHQGRVRGSRASKSTGGTAQAQLSGLPMGETITCRVQIGRGSATCRFRTPPQGERRIRFQWGGDVAGQGYGIDPSRGGMLTFRSMLEENPDFFLHSGDTIYADQPVAPIKELDDGTVWRSLVIPQKLRAARTLADFHANHRYNLLCPHYRDFFAQVPVIAQWDDHEVVDNWNPSEHGRLAQLGQRAFLDYWPVRRQNGKLYRKLRYGPHLELFVLDLRSFRAPNSANRQSEPGPETRLLGQEQLQWLKRSLASSKATWKVIAAEMPLSTYSPAWGLDNWANGDGPPLGRELELADILSFLHREQVKNVVWLSADVHFAAAIKFEPSRARFKQFDPFWEFIAGPLHAGTFPPAEPLDPTFGPNMEFLAVPPDLKPNRPPSDNLQFFGQVDIQGKEMRVSLHQRQGREIYAVKLQAESQ